MNMWDKHKEAGEGLINVLFIWVIIPVQFSVKACSKYFLICFSTQCFLLPGRLWQQKDTGTVGLIWTLKYLIIYCKSYHHCNIEQSHHKFCWYCAGLHCGNSDNHSPQLRWAEKHLRVNMSNLGGEWATAVEEHVRFHSLQWA